MTIIFRNKTIYVVEKKIQYKLRFFHTSVREREFLLSFCCINFVLSNSNHCYVLHLGSFKFQLSYSFLLLFNSCFFTFFISLKIASVDFTNILRTAFMLKDPQSANCQLHLDCLLSRLGSSRLKAARKMLVKLTPAVNFINVLCANFSYEYLFGSFSLVSCKQKKLPKRLSQVKFARKMLVKLAPGRRRT